MTAKVDKEQQELHLKYIFEHGVNFAERVIRINREITQELFDLVDNAMTEMESQNGKPITLRICSEGGDEYPAMAIVGRMQRSKCRIITEGYGQIMSAATLIFAAGAVRRISRYASFMWHESTYELCERHQNAKATVAYQEWMEKAWSQWMSEFTKKKKTPKFFLDSGKYLDRYWDAETLIKYGLADEII